MISCRWIYAITALSLLQSGALWSQATQQYNIGPTSVSSLLSQPSVSTILKDNTGFLWIGTQHGLHRYDGTKVTIFSAKNKSAHWIPNSDISQITQDKEGTIWAATYGGGLAKLNFKQDRFDAVFSDSVKEYSSLTTLTVSDKGNVWFGTANVGVGMYNPRLQNHATWLASNPANEDIGLVSDILQDGLGYIWVAGETGLHKIDPARRSISAYRPRALNGSITSNSKMTALELDANGILWIGTSVGKVFQFDPESLSFTLSETINKAGISTVSALAFSGDTLWIGTHSGLASFQTRQSTIELYLASNSDLSNNDVTSLHVSKEAVWVGTYQGLDFVAATGFEKYHHSNSGVFNDVLSFTQDSSKRIWVGTYDGVFLLTAQPPLHRSLDSIFEKIDLADHRVMTIAAKDQELWLGFRQNGVQVVNLTNGSTHKPEIPGNSGLAVTKILHTSEGSTWVATFNKGLFRLYPDGIRSFNQMTANFSEPTVVVLLEYTKNKLIIATERKIYSLDLIYNELDFLDLRFGDRNQPVTIHSITQNANGDIWIGTKDSGLYIWTHKNQASGNLDLISLGGEPSLPSDTIYAIVFDSMNDAWVSTARGLTKLSQKGEVLKSYTGVDGLQGADFNFGASFKDQQGRIYFGGTSGYNRFNPNKIDTGSPPPPLVLTELSIAGEQPPLQAPLHKVKSIELSHTDHFVTLVFSALDLLNKNSSRYRYKLEGFDPQWIEPGGRNSATYTNIPAGDYTFRAQVANAAGTWGLQGLSLNIRVFPAPWYSWWAITCYVLLALVLLRLTKGFYDTYILKEEATAYALETQAIADKAADDLQEQLEIQDDLMRSANKHNVESMQIISSLISEQLDHTSDPLTRDATQSNLSRVAALTRLESCLYYQDDCVLADLHKYTDIIIDVILKDSPIPAERITTINEVTATLLPAKQASLLSVVIFELVNNCVQHAFNHSSSANYIHIRLGPVDEQISRLRQLQLIVQDNGTGIAGSVVPDTAKSMGFSAVRTIAGMLSASMEISVDNGTQVSMLFPQQLDS
ncbi:MAG: hypothetical protein HOC23_22695 [Halieaceae bacterium]|jgi:ligand-binding sensor domain-containing protein/two-component sensor histidine kinase|nr:hypothetical protein [Halieaceae bacterium]